MQIEQLIKFKTTKYLLHLVLSLVIPFVITVISIAITGDREQGLSLGFVIGLLSLFFVNIAFPIFIFGYRKKVSIYSGILVTIISLGCTICYFILFEKYRLDLYFDSYGFWSSLIVYSISSILSWELIDKYLSKRELRNQEDSTS